MQKVFSELSARTGLDFRQIRKYANSDIDIHWVAGRIRRNGETYDGYAQPRSDWWTLRIVDYGLNRLTRVEKYIVTHEIGHAIGLRHPYDQPRNPLYSTRDTIMSYNGPVRTSFSGSDWLAIQSIWGS